MSEMLTAAQFVTNIDKFLFDSGMPVDSANILVEGIKLRDREIVDMVVKLFDKYASFDPHGNGYDAHIVCSNDLRDDLEKLKKSLTGGD